MLRDAADETEDMKIVEQFDISAIDTESLKGFRNHHISGYLCRPNVPRHGTARAKGPWHRLRYRRRA